jgi:hypothetical protein
MYKLYPYGLGWVWQAKEEDENLNPIHVGYRTNRDGEGLWKYAISGMGAGQLLGTTQFSLPRDRAGALRALKKIYTLERRGGSENHKD